MSNRPTLDDEGLGTFVGLVNRLISLVEVPPDLLLCLVAARDGVTDPLVHDKENADYWEGLGRGAYLGIDEMIQRDAPLIRKEIAEYGEDQVRALHRLDPAVWPNA